MNHIEKSLIDSLKKTITDKSNRKMPAVIKRIMGGEPDAIFVLAGGIRKDKDGKYRSLTYEESDTSGKITGSIYRIFATAEISHYFPNTFIVTTSKYAGVKPQEDNTPTIAKVMHDELTSLGVKKEKIILEEESTSTFTELFEMAKLTSQKHWKRIGVVTNGYHVPRIEKMYELIDKFSPDDALLESSIEYLKSRVKVTIISSEEILRTVNNDFKNLEKKVMTMAAYLDRVRLEEKGIRDLKEQKYKV